MSRVSIGGSPTLTDSIHLYDFVKALVDALHKGQIGRNLPMYVRLRSHIYADADPFKFQARLAGVRDGRATLYLEETLQGRISFDAQIAKASGVYEAPLLMRARTMELSGARLKPWMVISVPLRGTAEDCTVLVRQPPLASPTHMIGFLVAMIAERRGHVPRHAVGIDTNPQTVHMPGIRVVGRAGASAISVGVPVDSYVKVVFRQAGNNNMPMPVYVSGGVVLGRELEANRRARNEMRNMAMDTLARLRTALSVLDLSHVNDSTAPGLSTAIQEMMGMDKVHEDFSWLSEAQAGANAIFTDRVEASVLFCAMTTGTAVPLMVPATAVEFIRVCRRLPADVEKYQDRLFQEPNIFTTVPVQGKAVLPQAFSPNDAAIVTPTII